MSDPANAGALPDLPTTPQPAETGSDLLELSDVADAAPVSEPATTELVNAAETSDPQENLDPADILATRGDLSAGNTIELPDVDSRSSNEDQLFSKSSHTEYGIALHSDKAASSMVADSNTATPVEHHDAAAAAEPEEPVATSSAAEDATALSPLTSPLGL
jgi:hypothetical protein